MGAQVISMSWNITPPENPAVRIAFDQAIYKAKAKGALMFCATMDTGNFHDHSYPYASNPSHIFRIGAATAEGRTADFTTSDDNIDFILPGHDVVLNRLFGEDWGKARPASEAVSGSSVSTALAAGLAALVLECVRLGVKYTTETKQSDRGVAIKREDLRRIRTKEAMAYALNSISVNRRTGANARYIDVWDTFPDVTTNLKWNGGDKLNELEAIAGLARVFLRTGVKW